MVPGLWKPVGDVNRHGLARTPAAVDRRGTKRYLERALEPAGSDPLADAAPLWTTGPRVAAQTPVSPRH